MACVPVQGLSRLTVYVWPPQAAACDGLSLNDTSMFLVNFYKNYFLLFLRLVFCIVKLEKHISVATDADSTIQTEHQIQTRQI